MISPRLSTPVRPKAAPTTADTSNKHLEASKLPSQPTVKKPTCNLVKVISSAASPSPSSRKSLSINQRATLVYCNNYFSAFLPRSIPLSPVNLFSCVLVRMAASITSNPLAIETVFALCCISKDRFDAAVAFTKVSSDFIESNPAFARFLCNVGKLETLSLALKRRGQALGYHAKVLSAMPVRSHGSFYKAPRASELAQSACTVASDSATAALSLGAFSGKEKLPARAPYILSRGLVGRSRHSVGLQSHAPPGLPPPGLPAKKHSPCEVAAAFASYGKALSSVFCNEDVEIQHLKEITIKTRVSVFDRLGSGSVLGSGPSSGNATPLSNAGDVTVRNIAVDEVPSAEETKKKRTRRGGVKHRMRKNNGGGNV